MRAPTPTQPSKRVTRTMATARGCPHKIHIITHLTQKQRHTLNRRREVVLYCHLKVKFMFLIIREILSIKNDVCVIARIPPSGRCVCRSLRKAQANVTRLTRGLFHPLSLSHLSAICIYTKVHFN